MSRCDRRSLAALLWASLFGLLYALMVLRERFPAVLDRIGL